MAIGQTGGIVVLPAPDSERPHGLKYRLYYGQSSRCVVRYDNERGKGGHRHYGEAEGQEREENYTWFTVEAIQRNIAATSEINPPFPKHRIRSNELF